MRFFESVGLTALLVFGCASAQAADGVLISGKGTFGSNVATTALTAPNTDFSFSFLETDPITAASPFGGGGSGLSNPGLGYDVAFAGSFSFSLGSKPVQVGGKDLASYLSDIFFYDSAKGGGFDINFDLPTGSLTLTVLTRDSSNAVASLICADGSICAGSFDKASFSMTQSLDEGQTDGGSGTVTVTVADLQPTSAVPEPAGWVMMIGGFGLVGGALRRRRPLVAA